MIPAMIFFIVIAVVAAILVTATVHTTIHDSRGTRRPPRSHFDDPSFHGPGYLA